MFRVSAINILGTSTPSSAIQISLTCKITHDLAFVQIPISYLIGTAAVSFQIPKYTKNIFCPANEILHYDCYCSDGRADHWKPTLDGAISSTGGSIFEAVTSWQGFYGCVISAYTLPSYYGDYSFEFSLTMRTESSPTAPEPPIDFTITSTTSSSVEFSWNPPINDGGTPITSYEIYWDLGNGSWAKYESTVNTSLTA